MWKKTGVFSAINCFPEADCWGCNLSSCSWNPRLTCFSFICSSFWDSSLLLSSVLKNIQILLCFNFSLGRKTPLFFCLHFFPLYLYPNTWGWIMIWNAKIVLESTYGVGGRGPQELVIDYVKIAKEKSRPQTSDKWGQLAGDQNMPFSRGLFKTSLPFSSPK